MKTLYRARALLTAAIFACTVSHAATEVASDQPAVALAEVGFSLKLPKADNVVFRGAVTFDGAGGPNAQLPYPRDFCVAGFIVAISTHGAIVQSSRNAETARLPEPADLVLAHCS